jgi:NTE family protein
VFDSAPLRTLVEKNLPPGVRRFGDLTDVELYITVASLQSSGVYLYGEDPHGSLVDAVLASSAYPGGFAPFQVGQWQYADGGILANVPVSVAVEKGATTIYVLDVAYTGGMYGPARDTIGVLTRVASIVLHKHLLDELAYATQQPGVVVHHIIIRGVPQASDFNFDHGEEMVQVGYDTTQTYLARQAADETGLGVTPDWRAAVAPPPPGARLWVPPHRRSDADASQPRQSTAESPLPDASPLA